MSVPRRKLARAPRQALYIRIVICVAACVLYSPQVRAEPIFSYAFDQSSYNLSVGGTVDVTVLFRETDNTFLGSLPNGYLANAGLFGLGVLLDYSGQPAQVLQPRDVTANPDFLLDPTSASSVDVTSGQATLVENIGLGPFVTAPGVGPVYEIEVGVFRFTGLTTGIATIRGTVTGSGGDDVGGDGDVLDGFVASDTATITITGVSVVPEPGSIILMSIGCLSLAAMRHLAADRLLVR